MASPFGRTSRTSCGYLRRLVWQQARRELSIAHVFSTGVRLAPTLDDKQMLVRYCAEELEHFERAAALHDDLGGASAVEELPAESATAPGSWLEIVVAGYLLDQACYAQLRTYAASPDARLRDLADRLLGEERDHVDAASATLRELAGQGELAQMQAHADAWLPRALASLDPPCSDTDPCGVPHSNAETRRVTVEMFLTSVATLFTSLGLERRFSETSPALRSSPSGAVFDRLESPRRIERLRSAQIACATGVAPIARAIHHDSLRQLADEHTFEQGLEWCAAGRVMALDRRGNCLLATVRDRQDHTVTLWVSGDALAYSCDCPRVAEGTCCKHVVAVGLTWLAFQSG